MSETNERRPRSESAELEVAIEATLLAEEIRSLLAKGGGSPGRYMDRVPLDLEQRVRDELDRSGAWRRSAA